MGENKVLRFHLDCLQELVSLSILKYVYWACGFLLYAFPVSILRLFSFLSIFSN